MPQYRRPPLVERVVEFRADRDGPEDTLERITKRLRAEYPGYDDQPIVDFQIGARGEIQVIGSSIAQRHLRSANAVDVCIVKRNSIGVARQAPYDGWSALKARSDRAWHVWQKEMGKPRLSRLGSRALNRIDIPIAEIEGRSPQAYVNVGMGDPPFHAQVKAFNAQRTGNVGRYDLQMTAATTISPLIDHQSIVFDVDLSLANPPSANWDELAQELDLMNDQLNDIFEACVTDLSRAIFNR